MKDPERPGLRVLVVDDNRDAADALETLLELRGHTTRAVYGGEDALEVGAELEPLVVLLDLGMPEMDGFETARRLRAEPGAATSPWSPSPGGARRAIGERAGRPASTTTW